MVTIDLTAGTDLHTVDEFKRLVIKQKGDALVYLEDVANVTLGAESYDSSVAFSGKRSVFIGIKAAPNANILTVATSVRNAFPELQSQLPARVRGEIVYDSTEFINTSIVEVVKTLAEAMIIVSVVIYLFLGSFRAVIVPLVAIPLSLVGTFFVMYLLPFEFHVAGITIPFPDWIKATLGLALPIMANMAEILRGAVQSIPTAQWEAARSLAFSRRQIMWQIILPQCIKRMLPPWMNWYAILTMATTLASIVGVSEVMTITGRITNAEGRTDLLIPIYSYVLLAFFVYCYPIAVWTRRLEARYAER